MVARPHRPAVAVVGGTGCVGQHICAAFAQAGYQVVALARRPPGRAEGRGLPPDATFVSCDVAAATPARLAAMLAAHEVSVIIHATGGWGLSEREMRTAPGQVVTRLVEAISRLPYRPRLVHVGTIHEYGPVPPDVAITERTVPAPQTLYARTKLAESGYVLERVAAGHLDGVVLRLVNTFGPYPAPESFLTSVIRRLLDGEQGVQLTVADARRDYLDARDAAAAVLAAARVRRADPLVNVGQGHAMTVRDMVRMLVQAGGLPPDAVRIRIGSVPSKGADHTVVDTRHARQALGWRPRYTAAESFRAMWQTLRAADPAAVVR